jgi:hypothetical protein
MAASERHRTSRSAINWYCGSAERIPNASISSAARANNASYYKGPASELTDPNILSRRGGIPGTYALLDTGFSGDGPIGKGSVPGHDSSRVSILHCIWEDWTYTNLVVGVEEQANLLGLRFLATPRHAGFSEQDSLPQTNPRRTVGMKCQWSPLKPGFLPFIQAISRDLPAGAAAHDTISIPLLSWSC